MTLLSGALVAVAAAAANETASDIFSFTPEVVERLSMSAQVTLAQALNEASKQVLSHWRELQRPRIIVRPRRGAVPAGSGKRWALYIANITYETNPGGRDKVESLKNPGNQTRALKRLLTLRGWRTWGAPQQGVRYHKRARDIEALFRDALESPLLQSGDSILLYFSGHGLPEGLLGSGFNYDASEIASHRRLAEHVSQARARGIDVLIVLDACHTGAFVDLLREAQIEELAPLVESTRFKPLFRKVLKLYQQKQQARCVIDNLPSGILKPDDVLWLRNAWRGQLAGVLASTLQILSALDQESRGQGSSRSVSQSIRAVRERISVHLGRPEEERQRKDIARRAQADLDDLLEDVFNEALLFIESSLPA